MLSNGYAGLFRCRSVNYFQQRWKSVCNWSRAVVTCVMDYGETTCHQNQIKHELIQQQTYWNNAQIESVWNIILCRCAWRRYSLQWLSSQLHRGTFFVVQTEQSESTQCDLSMPCMSRWLYSIARIVYGYSNHELRQYNLGVLRLQKMREQHGFQRWTD